MDQEKLFDLICHARDVETAGTNYKITDKIELTPAQQEKVIHKSLQAFMHGVGCITNRKEKMAIQAFSGSSDLPSLTKDVFNVTNQVNEYDLFWQHSFKTIPLKKGQLAWEIADVTSGYTMELIPEGGKVKIFSISGTKAIVTVDKYGFGLGVTWEIIEGRKLYQFMDLMEHARAEIYGTWADVHYALLATAGATNAITWQSSGTNLNRDILTLNAGLHAISEDNKDSGYGAPSAFKFKLYPDPILEERIEAAFRFTNSASDVSIAVQVTPVQLKKRNIQRFYSYNSNIPTNKALLVVSGNKIQNSIYLRELGLSEKQIESLNEIRTYWSAFGAAIGDNDQVYELAFA